MTKQSLWDRLKQIYSGRLNRWSLLKGYLATCLPFLIIFISYALIQILEIVFGVDLLGNGLLSFVYVILGLLAFVYAGFVSLSVLIRRHHDLNQDWYYPLLIIGGLSLLSLVDTDIARLCQGGYVLALLFIKGSEAENRYGLPDKGKNIYQIIGLRK